MRPLPGGIRVQRARRDDAARVRDLVVAAIESYKEWAPDWEPVHPPPERQRRLAENFDTEDAWVLMALAGDELVGVVSLALSTGADPRLPPAGTIYLWQMFVTPAWQGTGLAQALLDLAAEEARKRGFNRLTLWAAAGAKQARRFYEKEGWTATGREDPDSSLGLPLVEYEITIR